MTPSSNPPGASLSWRACLVLLLVAVGSTAGAAESVLITFDEPELAPGLVTNIVRGSNEVRLITRTRLFTPAVPTSSGTRAVVNDGQVLVGDETGFQKPMILDFNRLQSRVAVRVGLNDLDFSVSNVLASLTAYDASGSSLGEDAVWLGTGPRPVTTRLEVRRPMGDIRRVAIAYSGNNAEVVDDLEFEPAPGGTVQDLEPPVFRWITPGSRSVLVYPREHLHGEIWELSGLEVTVNGIPAAVARQSPTIYSFDVDLSLPTDVPTVDLLIEARDEFGNVSQQRLQNLVRQVPTQFQRGAVRFTQSGLFDPAASWPARLVAGKTALLEVEGVAQTALGQPAAVDTVVLRIQTPSGFEILPAQRLLDERFVRYVAPWPRLEVTNFFFLIPGSSLGAEWHSFTLEVAHGGALLYTEVLAAGVVFRTVPGVRLLLQPQDRTWPPALIRSLVQTLQHFARIFPVPDGVGSLYAANNPGIQFGLLPPLSYRGHTDPADNPAISYEQGFLLTNHWVINWGTNRTLYDADDFPQLYAGPFLCTDYSWPLDENRNRIFESSETNRLAGGMGSDVVRRLNNWGRHHREGAEQARLAWNRDNPGWPRVAQAISLLTSGADGQNYTGWAGSAAAGQTAFWADLPADATPFLAHESGHAFGLPHSTGCILATGYDVLGMARRTNSVHLMCPTLGGGPAWYFLPPANYNALFFQFRNGSLATASFARQADGRSASALQFNLSGWIHQDGTAEIIQAFLDAAVAPAAVDTNLSPYTVVFLDSLETTLAQVPFSITFEDSDAELVWSAAPFSLSVPFPDETAHVEVRKHGSPLKRLTRSAHPPRVQNVLATVVPESPEPSLNITWMAEDEDGDPLVATLSQSTDGGVAWIPLPLGAATSPALVPLEGVAGGDKVVVKVTVSDGFHTAEAMSPPIALPNQPPVAVILRPEPGQLLNRGDPVQLSGLAWDAEATAQSAPSLDWYLVDGAKTNWLGNQPALALIPLPPGKHLLRLVATDSQGATSTEDRVVQVVDLAPAPSLYFQWHPGGSLQLYWDPEPSTVLESSPDVGPDAVWTPVAEADLVRAVFALRARSLKLPNQFFRLSRH